MGDVSLSDGLNPLERRFLTEVLRGLRALDNTSRGLFAKVLVAANLPGALRCDDAWEA
jgi:hypothetical protein